MAVTSPADQIIETLNAAATLIRRHGWCQNSHKDECGRLSLGQALYTASDSLTDEGAGRDRRVVMRQFAARGALLAHTNVDDRALTLWQDRPGRTAEEVFYILEGTVRRLGALPPATAHEPPT